MADTTPRLYCAPCDLVLTECEADLVLVDGAKAFECPLCDRPVREFVAPEVKFFATRQVEFTPAFASVADQAPLFCGKAVA